MSAGTLLPETPGMRKCPWSSTCPASIGTQTHSVSKETWQSSGVTRKVESTLLALGCLRWEWGSKHYGMWKMEE